MFDYSNPFDPYNAKDCVREIARLTRLLGEATIRNAQLLEGVVAVTAEADEATAAARQASNLGEDERMAFQRTISKLQTENSDQRLRANVAEDTTKHYAERAEAAEAKMRALEHQITDYQLQLAAEQSNHRNAANRVGKLQESEKVNQKHIAALEARVKELEKDNEPRLINDMARALALVAERIDLACEAEMGDLPYAEKTGFQAARKAALIAVEYLRWHPEEALAAGGDE